MRTLCLHSELAHTVGKGQKRVKGSYRVRPYAVGLARDLGPVRLPRSRGGRKPQRRHVARPRQRLMPPSVELGFKRVGART